MKSYIRICYGIVLAINIPSLGLASSQLSIEKLPDEILINVFQRLDVQSQENVALVNKQFRTLACDAHIEYGKRRAENIEKAIDSFCKAMPSTLDNMVESQAKLIINMPPSNDSIVEAKLNAYHFLFKFSKNKDKKSQYANGFLCLYNAHKNSVSPKFGFSKIRMEQYLKEQKTLNFSCIMQ